MKIVNLTPHNINVIKNGETLTFPASGTIARVAVNQRESGEIDGIPCFTQEYGELENVPESDGNYYLVSGLVKSASNRKDLIAPDTGKTAIRNEKGHIVAVTQFII